MNLVLTPQQRLQYLSETDRKRKSNEAKLQKIMKNPTDNEKFLAELLETAIIIAMKNPKKPNREKDDFKYTDFIQVVVKV